MTRVSRAFVNYKLCARLEIVKFMKRACHFIVLLAVVWSLTCVVGRAQDGWAGSRITSGGKDLNAVFFTDSKRGWVAGDSGFLAYTDDAGLTWIERPLGIDHSINDIYFVSKESGFVLAGGTIYETSNAGHSWRESHKFSPSDFEGATPELYSLRFS